MTEGDRNPLELRISDADRHKVAEILRQAAGDGRLDFEELDERLEGAYAARTYADLVPLTADLPTRDNPAAAVTSPAPVPAGANPNVVVAGGPQQERGIAIMSGFDRKGSWIVPANLDVFCLMGGAELDLREARFAAQEVTIRISAIMGGADITVPHGMRVVVDGMGVMGAFTHPRASDVPEDPNGPLVRITGFALMGGVDVQRRGPKGSRRLRGRRRELPGP